MKQATDVLRGLTGLLSVRASRALPAPAPTPPAAAAAATPAPPATAAPAEAAATASPSAAATRAVLAGPGLVHGELAAVELLAVQGVDRRRGLTLVAHLHEPEAAGAAGVAVGGQLGRLDGAVLLEQSPQG